MTKEMQEKMEELAIIYDVPGIARSNSYFYEKGFTSCFDLMSREVEELQKNWDDELEASNKRAMQNIELRDQLKIAREALEKIALQIELADPEMDSDAEFSPFAVSILTKLSNTEGAADEKS